MPYWDAHGAYAVFAERSPIAFQASALREASRYGALKNFGFINVSGCVKPKINGDQQRAGG